MQLVPGESLDQFERCGWIKVIRAGHSMNRKEVAPDGKSVAMSHLLDVAVFCSECRVMNPYTGRIRDELPPHLLRRMEDRVVEDDVDGTVRVIMWILTIAAPHDPLAMMALKDSLFRRTALWVNKPEMREKAATMLEWAKEFETERNQSSLVHKRGVITIAQPGDDEWSAATGHARP